MGRIKKNWLLIRLVLYFAIALFIAELSYLKVDYYIKQSMGKCYFPAATSVIQSDGVRFPFFNNTEENYSMPVVINSDRLHKLETLEYIVPIVIFGTAILIAAILFYYINIRKPLKQLRLGIDKITNQDLDFEITYHGKDELGKLCVVFESMRENLKATFYDYWKAEEQQANLYSSIAHDLRTPLTILKGNNEVLRLLIVNNSSSDEIIKTLDISDDAIKRMERYTDALKQMKALEKWDKEIEDVNLQSFAAKLQTEGRQLAEGQNKILKVENQCIGKCMLDQTLVQLVIDRLLENAIRFARKEIIIRILTKQKEQGVNLIFEVLDDGDGFSDMALKKATTLFFTTDSARKHSGIGLAAANSLLKNYNSCIHIENQADSGAMVWFEIAITNSI